MAFAFAVMGIIGITFAALKRSEYNFALTLAAQGIAGLMDGFLEVMLFSVGT